MAVTFYESHLGKAHKGNISSLANLKIHSFQNDHDFKTSGNSVVIGHDDLSIEDHITINDACRLMSSACMTIFMINVIVKDLGTSETFQLSLNYFFLVNTFFLQQQKTKQIWQTKWCAVKCYLSFHYHT